MFWQQHPGQFLLLVSSAQVPYPARGWGRAGSRAGGICGISHAWLGVSDGSLQKNMCSSDLSPRDWQALVSSLDSKPGDTQGAPEEASKVVRCLLGMCTGSAHGPVIILRPNTLCLVCLGQTAASATPLGSD